MKHKMSSAQPTAIQSQGRITDQASGWQDPGGQSEGPEDSASVPIWEQMFRRSLLHFASPELEAGYEAYLANHAGDYLLAFMPIFVFALFDISYCTAVNGQTTWADPPPGLVFTMLLYFLPAGVLIAFAWLRKSVYAKHWRGINVAFMMVHIFHQNFLHILLIWQQSCISKGLCQVFKSRKSSDARPSWINAFAMENFYLIVICLRLAVLTAGQAPDLFFTTVGMLISMSGNNSLCGSTIWGPERVSLSPTLSSIPRKATALILAMFSPHAQWQLPEELPCPVVLAFWQVLGWLGGCLLIIIREIFSRRAYLKSVAGRFGPSIAAHAKSWPFGNAVIMHRLIQAVLLACFTAVVMWVAASLVFQM